ncbi:4-hydroxyphenylpyruvate dioxygenase [Pseudoclavibacter sp. RFBJ3]|uniref:sugar phosphate isomerase/epimerase and 4-hydroxyphenylpyruvate domain-containing protein n=1 Tax=unclassified Pseudoclavibacter TaxID=2615177 RepID=UPI000CE81C41|nr:MULTISPECIES: sugar phosphate isomerase/epimerase and 4-hydroxyphenylpyruvate domain-containing protein [unclassified Pseudoclavibacter]PPF84420.1 4-hydroxyphenylpyruvate dioxygenase [Pseudoclavibacter sp. RFBJ5]PPF92679.1 4-hydroxyphenylpyruvate dioxygenase [Pseudoclavibacter sp. RFBJ3]PPF98248.1 4-hydroxyphenylpyruvate dioxygenase [Pseudoclavibacter sp. RFBH5]PPG25318.1 4-hydroxyphenylpyruvate dioxygenase [Pseudoclavibacter sp. RFBI4]
MRTSIATVCLAGTLVEKLHACAEAGFDGIEIMDADLTAAYESPEEIRALCDRLGLTIDLFQPLRDFEGVDDATLADNLRRAKAKFEVMRRLGASMILLCSNVGTATISDRTTTANQLGMLADLAAEYSIDIAYEALAWGRYVDDYRDAWELVRLADRPNLGVCLDSFHVLSRGHDPAAIERIDADKLFFLQLADAPDMDLDVLSWSRHHRLFPGEGDFDLTRFLSHMLRAGYRGPLSLEVFNDTFRQTDAKRTAAHALRSLRWLFDRSAALNGWDDQQLAPPQPPRAIDFVEIAGEDLSAVEATLQQLGFAFGGRHRTKPVRLWQAGAARIILNEQRRTKDARLSGLGVEVADAGAAAGRAHAIGAPAVFRRSSAGEYELRGVEAPDGTEVAWNSRSAGDSWLPEFVGGAEDDSTASSLHGVVDHLNIAYPWQEFDEAVLFFRSVLALDAEPVAELPGPRGLVRSQVMRTPDGAVRLAMNLAPPTAPLQPRHIAIRVDDAVAAARAARGRGLPFLPIPSNYYDDLQARFGLEHVALDELRELDLLYDRDEQGAFVHFYTPTIDGLFFEIVERRGAYDGYGAASTPVRFAAQLHHAGRYTDDREQGEAARR